MKSLSVCVLLAVVATVYSASLAVPSTFSDKSYDYLLYAEEYGPSLCAIANDEHSGSCSYVQALKGFTTHGVWPNRDDGSYPSFCGGAQYNAGNISSIRSYLERTWPNLIVGTSYDDFWSHEWDKHGTCVTTGPIYNVTNPQYAYFYGAIQLNNRVNVLGAMTSAGMPPSTTATYKLADIKAAFVKAYGFTGEIKCAKDYKTGDYYLSVIWLCLSKDLQSYRTCSSSDVLIAETQRSSHSLPRSETCPDNTPLRFPPASVA